MGPAWLGRSGRQPGNMPGRLLQALALGLRAQVQTFGVYKLDLANTEKAQEVADVGALGVERRAGITTAARCKDIGAFAGQEAFGSLRWGVMCAGMANAFRTVDPNVERAVIARRASETEIDLMRLMAA